MYHANTLFTKIILILTLSFYTLSSGMFGLMDIPKITHTVSANSNLETFTVSIGDSVAYSSESMQTSYDNSNMTYNRVEYRWKGTVKLIFDNSNNDITLDTSGLTISEERWISPIGNSGSSYIETKTPLGNVTGYSDLELSFGSPSSSITLKTGKQNITNAQFQQLKSYPFTTSSAGTKIGIWGQFKYASNYFMPYKLGQKGNFHMYSAKTMGSQDAMYHDGTAQIASRVVGGSSSGGGPCGDSGGGGGGGQTIIVNPAPNIIVQGGGGSIITIPRYDYNHNASNTHTTISQSTTGGKELGEVKDNSKETVLKTAFTNIPSSGVIYLSGRGFQPQSVIQYKNDSGLVASGDEEETATKKFLKDNSIVYLLNKIDLNVIDMKDKTIEDFESHYTACPSTPAKGVECTKVTHSSSVKDMNGFKISKPGRYLLTAYVTAGSEKYLVYRIVDARSGDDFTGIPIPNRLTTMIENKNIKEKTKSKQHSFGNLQFTSGSNKEESLKTLSVNNSITNRIVVGSTDKGVKMFDNDLTEASLSGASLTDASISRIIEVEGTTNVVVSCTTKGAYIINTATGQTVKINGLLSDNIQSVVKLNNLFYLTFDNDIAIYYIDDTDNAHIRDRIASSEIFGSNVKLGDLGVLGDKIIINTHHQSNISKMAIVSKF